MSYLIASPNNSLTLYDEAPAGGAVFYTLTATGKGAVSTGTGWVTNGSTTSETDTKYGYIVKSVHMDVISGSIPSSLTGRSNYQDIEIMFHHILNNNHIHLINYIL